MKKSKKSKTLLTSTVGLLAATSVVAPLATMTSCSNANTQLEFVADKEYGVTEHIYNDLKEQFQIQYKNKLSLDHDEEYVAEHLDYLKKQLMTLDQMKEEKTNGFTSLTSAIVQFAKTFGKDLDGNPYNIHLDRKSNAQWSQLDTIFASWKGSFSTYMWNSDMSQSTINRVMKDAETKFNNLKNNLMKTCVDALDGVIQGKELLITCFEEVNDEIALVSASLQLKQFMNQYSFETKTEAGACLDNITNPDSAYYAEDFKEGSLLSAKTMNQIFTITRKETNTSVKYSPTLIKGYTIQPKLIKISQNKYSNTNIIAIDFGLVKTNYIGKYSKEKLASVTAHLYCGDNWGDFENFDENTTLSQVMSLQKIKFIEYSINLTKEGEHKALKEVYFNKKSEEGYISFQWDNKNANNQAYESFFDNAKKNGDGTWTAQLSENSLMNSGLMITDNTSKTSSYKFIWDFLGSDKIDSKNIRETKLLSKLSEKFLSACEISANVTINELNESRKVVSIDKFYVNYNNSTYKYDNEGKCLLANSQDYAIYQNECVNHTISNAFYEKVNNNFNNILNFAKYYDNTVTQSPNSNKNAPITETGLEQLRNDAELELFNSIMSLIMGTISVAILICQIWTPWSKANIQTKWANITMLISEIGQLVAHVTLFTLWVIRYYNPMMDFLHKYKDFKDFSPRSDFIGALRNALNDHFVLINDDGSYDKKEFETKKKAFSAHSMEWMLEQYSVYSNKENVYGWSDYKDELKNKHVEPEELKPTIAGWNAGGKYWMIQWAIMIGMILVSMIMWTIGYFFGGIQEYIRYQNETKMLEQMAAEKQMQKETIKAMQQCQLTALVDFRSKLTNHSDKLRDAFVYYIQNYAMKLPRNAPKTQLFTVLTVEGGILYAADQAGIEAWEMGCDPNSDDEKDFLKESTGYDLLKTHMRKEILPKGMDKKPDKNFDFIEYVVENYLYYD